MTSVINWRELAAAEVLTTLERQPGTAPVSGFLDTHQWAPLLGHPAIRLAGGHPTAQFRRASSSIEPVVCCAELPLDELPPSLRAPRSLRRYLEQQLDNPSLLGDLLVGRQQHGQSVARVFLTAGDLLSRLAPLPFEVATAVVGFTVTPTTASIASLRLDAVVATAFKVSRAEADTAVRHGFVFVDFQPALQRTQLVRPGNQLVFRTKGRAELLSADRNDRSGRFRVQLGVYPA